MNAPFIVAAMIGLGATALTDLWNLLLKRALHVSSLNVCLLGRWVSHMRLGTVRHANIVAASSYPGECVLGWLVHYGIGASLAIGFVLVAPAPWLHHPSLLPALSYGLATAVFPFFVLQPALGLGIASSRAAKPFRARLKSLGTHTVFGLGLYVVSLFMTS